MKRKLIAITLIAVLICVVAGNSFACTGTGTYTLIISSTAGGNVTTPGEGTYTYNATTVVNLVATPDPDYRFDNWTATAGTFANANAQVTTFTMPAQDATVTAHFAFGTLIPNVPDVNQPPTMTLATTPPGTSYCAPMAMVNILGYWDVVMGHANAYNLTAWLQPPNLNTVAEYLGYFMDTNDTGSPDRANGQNPPASLPGTYNVDIGPGAMDFVRWDAANPLPVNPDPQAPVLPAGKLGYVWLVGSNCDVDPTITLNFYKHEIDSGRPLVVAFDFWNPLPTGISVTDPLTGETIDVFIWGGWVSNSSSPNPVEYWDYGTVGHAVTGVGYIPSWDPDGSGSIPLADWVIVHDNWSTTPKNVAIPWAWWMCLWQVIP